MPGAQPFSVRPDFYSSSVIFKISPLSVAEKSENVGTQSSLQRLIFIDGSRYPWRNSCVYLRLNRNAQQATGQIDALVKSLSRFATRQQLIDLSKDVSVSQVYHLGAAHVVSKMTDRLGLKRMLERLAAEHPRMKLPLAKNLF